MKASARLNGEVNSDHDEAEDVGDEDSDDELLAGLENDPEVKFANDDYYPRLVTPC